MRAVIQRVSQASVRVKEEQIGQIQTGLLVLLGVEEGDDASDLEYIVQKTIPVSYTHLDVYKRQV